MNLVVVYYQDQVTSKQASCRIEAILVVVVVVVVTAITVTLYTVLSFFFSFDLSVYLYVYRHAKQYKRYLDTFITHLDEKRQQLTSIINKK